MHYRQKRGEFKDLQIDEKAIEEIKLLKKHKSATNPTKLVSSMSQDIDH